MKDKIINGIQFVFLFGWVCHFFGHRKLISEWRVHLNKDDILGHGAFRIKPNGDVIVLKRGWPIEVTPTEIYRMREIKSCILCNSRVAELEYSNLDEFRTNLIQSLVDNRCYNPWFEVAPECREMIVQSFSSDEAWLEKQ